MTTKNPLLPLGLSLAALALGLAASAEPSRACKGLRVIGLTTDQRLVSFKACRPDKTREIGAISGLGAGADALIGIDFRVSRRLLPDRPAHGRASWLGNLGDDVSDVALPLEQ